MSDHPTDEQELIERALQKDTLALQQLLLRRYEWLAAYIGRRIPTAWKSTLSVEDLLQETFVKAFRGLDAFEPAAPGAIFSWLQTIAKNQITDAIRRQSRIKEQQAPMASGEDESLDAGFPNLIQELAISDDPRASVVARLEELKHAFYVAMAQLPHDQRQVIQLQYLEGLSVREVADRMHKTTGAIRGLSIRAKEKLKSELVRLSLFV